MHAMLLKSCACEGVLTVRHRLQCADLASCVGHVVNSESGQSWEAVAGDYRLTRVSVCHVFQRVEMPH